MFSIVWAAVLILSLAYIVFIGREARRGGSADERSRANYFDTVKTLVTAAGVAIAIVTAGLQQKFGFPVWILRRATVSLCASVVLSVGTMLEMSRVYEQARRHRGEPVQLSGLVTVLTLGYFSMTTFFLGFAYLARLTFYM